MEKVCIHLANGFEEIEALAVVDILRRAEIATEIVSITGQKEVTGAHDITVIADSLFEEVNYEEVKMILLPGGMPGSRNLDQHQGLRNQIKNFHTNGKPLGAICAAPLVLGSAGVLKGKAATCYPGFEKELPGAKVSGQPIIRDGNIITGKGAGYAMHFALEIVKILKDNATAEHIKNAMFID